MDAAPVLANCQQGRSAQHPIKFLFPRKHLINPLRVDFRRMPRICEELPCWADSGGRHLCHLRSGSC